MIETIEDIVEELADRVGVYGASNIHADLCPCRVCWTMQLRSRLRAASEIERKLYGDPASVLDATNLTGQASK